MKSGWNVYGDWEAHFCSQRNQGLLHTLHASNDKHCLGFNLLCWRYRVFSIFKANCCLTTHYHLLELHKNTCIDILWYCMAYSHWYLRLPHKGQTNGMICKYHKFVDDIRAIKQNFILHDYSSEMIPLYQIYQFYWLNSLLLEIHSRTCTLMKLDAHMHYHQVACGVPLSHRCDPVKVTVKGQT